MIFTLCALRCTSVAFHLESPGADSRHNRFGISQCHCEAVAHRHGHSYRTVFVLDLNDPCLGIRHADEIIVLQKGEIVERGTHDSLIAQNGFYKRLVDMQEVK
mgnify:CR=1 FL=1